MANYCIARIDSRVNKAPYTPMEKALENIIQHILKNIDPRFPSEDFLAWCNSGDDKPLKVHGNTYSWE